jgi:hypothetical protein
MLWLFHRETWWSGNRFNRTLTLGLGWFLVIHGVQAALDLGIRPDESSIVLVRESTWTELTKDTLDA